MNILGGLYKEGFDEPCDTGRINKFEVSKPRTLTEQLNDKIAYHEFEVTKLKEALAALTPDVERALNALSKL